MGLLAAIMLAVYLANPFGTASLDPRARLLGVALYKIPSRSMEPTLQQGDFILANAARYAFADPQVGDLVVFRFPPQRSIAYVKRIAGIPGDRVRIDGGRLYVNERPVTEPYLAQQALRQPDSCAWPSGPSPPATTSCSATTATTPTTAATGATYRAPTWSAGCSPSGMPRTPGASVRCADAPQKNWVTLILALRPWL